MRNARLAATAVGVVLTLGVASHAASQTGTPVMSNLDNPRGLAVAPNGALYVTEAGVGGPPNLPHVNNCALNAVTQEYRCYGATGRVQRLWRGVVQIVAEGLPSHAAYNHPTMPNGGSAAGPNRIAFGGGGNAFITLGLGGDEHFAERLGAGAPFFGSVIQLSPNGRWRVVGDVLDHETAENPEPTLVDTNPFGIAVAGNVRYVADAGGNSVLAVYSGGRVETLAAFPPRQGATLPLDTVPTGIAVGPDGALYVGELTGFPFPQGAARIHRLVPGSPAEVFLEGFKTIMDLAFDDAGNLYVLEHATGAQFPPPFLPNSGRVTRIAPDGTRTVVASGLNRPTAIAIGLDGELYVTNNGVVPGAGEVRRIDLD